jgi:predicted alpha/beta superfamily hydrolase
MSREDLVKPDQAMRSQKPGNNTWMMKVKLLRMAWFESWLAVLALIVPFGGMPALGEQPRAETQVIVSVPQPEPNGILVHEVASPYQAGKTSIRVLVPEVIQKDRRYGVIYLLPVEAGAESRYGDGLAEVKKLRLHNKHSVIFVTPTFSHLPWYADHPDNPEIRQEAYFLKVVVPFIEKTYPVQADADHRLLLGFSKSGWGAWSLLLRHPDLFGQAAAWDAPLMMDTAGKYGSAEIFGTQENFAKYRIESLLRTKSKELGTSERLILTGYGGFREEHVRVHELMTRLKIPHVYQDGSQRKHDWHSGWVREAVELLLRNEKRE